jgi:hypothetical protein
MLENRVLRNIFGPNRDEIRGDWRNPHNEELHNLYSWSNRIMKSRNMRSAGHIACIGAKKNEYRVLAGILEGK